MSQLPQFLIRLEIFFYGFHGFQGQLGKMKAGDKNEAVNPISKNGVTLIMRDSK